MLGIQKGKKKQRMAFAFFVCLVLEQKTKMLSCIWYYVSFLAKVFLFFFMYKSWILNLKCWTHICCYLSKCCYNNQVHVFLTVTYWGDSLSNIDLCKINNEFTIEYTYSINVWVVPKMKLNLFLKSQKKKKTEKSNWDLVENFVRRSGTCCW